MADYLVARGLVPRGVELTVEELAGGVSGTVLAVRGPGIALVVKQALPRLRVADEWIAPARRTDTEAAALRLAARLIPGRVPPVVDSDDARARARAAARAAPAGATGRPSCSPAARTRHPAAGPATRSARLHAATAGDAEVAAAFGDYEAFAQLRLEPYHGVVMQRLPQLAAALQPLVDELRDARTCLVHGDYAPKNILLGPDGAWVLDAEVAHYGHPVFDLAFFLAFPLLTALQRPELAPACSELVEGFTTAYAHARAGARRRSGALAGRAHGRDAAGAHRRPLAGDVPRRSRARAGARARPAAAARSGARPGGGGGVMRVSERSIEQVLAFEALDSRGTPTVACVVSLAGGAQACATVPAGASTGRHEAHERARRRPPLRRAGRARGGGRCQRRDRRAAARARRSRSGRDRRRAARPRRHARALAAGRQRGAGGFGRLRTGRRRGRAHAALAAARPRPSAAAAAAMVNVLSGGAHAGGAVDVQDVLVIPLAARTFAEAIEHAARVRHGAAAELRARGHDTALVADEGGLAAPLASNEEALEIASRGIERAGHRGRAGTRRGGHAALRRRRLPAGLRGAAAWTAPRWRSEIGRLGAALPARLDRGSARRGRLGRLAARHRAARQRRAAARRRPLRNLARAARARHDGRASPTPCWSSPTRPARSRARARRSSWRSGRATRPSSRRARATARTPGSPISPSAGAAARSRSARRSARSARPSGIACCASRPSAPTRSSRRGASRNRVPLRSEPCATSRPAAGAPALGFCDTLLAGLASDGGLYVPERWPALPRARPGESYASVAAGVVGAFAGDELAPALLERLCAEAYASFRHPAVCPLVQLDAGEWLLELFHGPTLAFKDLALQLVGRLFEHVLSERDERITVLVATSGDTGSAAISGLASCSRAEIVVLYPEGRVSDVQRRQMTTVDAPNVHAVAVDGHVRRLPAHRQGAVRRRGACASAPGSRR